MRIAIPDKGKFVLRVAGIFLHEDKVLFHRADHEDIWALPGGGCEFFEQTYQALVREIQEELDAEVDIGRLAFTVENFFELGESKAHEIGFYYLCNFKGASKHLYDKLEFEGIEEKMDGFNKFKLHFLWIPFKSLGDYKIKPDFLLEQLKDLGQHSKHIVHIEVE